MSQRQRKHWISSSTGNTLIPITAITTLSVKHTANGDTKPYSVIANTCDGCTHELGSFDTLEEARNTMALLAYSIAPQPDNGKKPSFKRHVN